MFPNQKPWFNADIRMKIRSQCAAFKSGDTVEYKQAWYELQKSIRAAKRTYSQKLERCYRDINTRSMWQGIQSISNYRSNTNRVKVCDSTLPDTLNSFYGRFDRTAIPL